MNATNTTTAPSQDDPWKESGAMVYVALSVATFSAVTMCCVWFILHHPSVRAWLHLTRGYDNVDDDEEAVQLASRSLDSPSSEVEDLEASPTGGIAEAVSDETAESFTFDETAESFTFEDSDSEEEIPLDMYTADV